MRSMKAQLHPVVYCDSCKLALLYIHDPAAETMFLEHGKWNCPRSGQKFKLPMVELELIESSPHEGVYERALAKNG